MKRRSRTNPPEDYWAAQPDYAAAERFLTLLPPERRERWPDSRIARVTLVPVAHVAKMRATLAGEKNVEIILVGGR